MLLALKLVWLLKVKLFAPFSFRMVDDMAFVVCYLPFEQSSPLHFAWQLHVCVSKSNVPCPVQSGKHCRASWSMVPQSGPFHPFLHMHVPAAQYPWPEHVGCGQSTVCFICVVVVFMWFRPRQKVNNNNVALVYFSSLSRFASNIKLANSIWLLWCAHFLIFFCRYARLANENENFVNEANELRQWHVAIYIYILSYLNA